MKGLLLHGIEVQPAVLSTVAGAVHYETTECADKKKALAKELSVLLRANVPGGSAVRCIYAASSLGIAAGLTALKLPLEGALTDCVAVGELSMDGRLRPVKGTVAYARYADAHGLRLICPSSMEPLASHYCSSVIHADTFDSLLAECRLAQASAEYTTPVSNRHAEEKPRAEVCIERLPANVVARAVQAFEQGKHVLLIGQAGTGKTLLAQYLVSLLPELDAETADEVNTIWSVDGLLHESPIRYAPLRAPHHTCSMLGIEGELSLAHGGALFLDELPEFRRNVLDAVHSALLDGAVRHAGRTVPARFRLIAAMNPCPCGAGPERCRCSAESIERYLSRVPRWIRELCVVVKSESEEQ